MLRIFPTPGGAGKEGADLGAAVWVDLLDPTPAESAAVAAVIGASLPTRDALSEIETSSRLRRQNGALVMSTPTAAHRGAGETAVAPVGFVLSRERLITVRFAALPAFDALAQKFEAGGPDAPKAGLEVFTELCEEIVDRVADGLERLAEHLGALSVETFHADDTKGRQAIRSNRVLRIQLHQLGRLGDRLSEVRDGLLGLGRVVAFTDQFAEEWCDTTLKARLTSLRQDIVSLSDYEAHLANKVQFVLDAMVGLIGIAQNDIFKVLTIVSIVGIPPTLVASMYGMNFKNMPELSWYYGYPYALAMIVLSAVVPVIWFKLKGWF